MPGPVTTHVCLCVLFQIQHTISQRIELEQLGIPYNELTRRPPGNPEICPVQ